MKINSNLTQALGLENKITSKKQAAQAPKKAQEQKFDKIIIDKAQEMPVNMSEFAANLASKVSNEIKLGADSQRLHNIQGDILKGDYAINSEEIVRKMMIGLR
ncbi:MAG: hypothetical protein RR846_04965 [Oscillospiraceae bacterium]